MKARFLVVGTFALMILGAMVLFFAFDARDEDVLDHGRAPDAGEVSDAREVARVADAWRRGFGGESSRGEGPGPGGSVGTPSGTVELVVTARFRDGAPAAGFTVDVATSRAGGLLGSAVTGADGVARLFGLPRDVLHVRAGGGEPEALDLTGARDMAEHVVELDAAETVAGRVVDHVGRGVAGAEVHASRLPLSELGSPIARTTEDGSFRLVAPRGTTHLVARKPGHAESRSRAVVLPHDASVELVLGDVGATVTFHVTDAEDVPLESATLRLQHVRPAAGEPESAHRPGYSPRMGESDAAGIVRFTDLPPGGWTWFAMSGAGAPAQGVLETRSGGVIDVRVAIGSGARVEGLVLDEALQPVPDAKVTWSSDLSFTDLGVQTRTDVDGRFALDRLPVGGGVIEAAHAGLRTRTALVLVHAESRVVDIVLRRTVDLRGRCMSAGGDPVAGVRIAVTSRGKGVPVSADATTDADGAFVLAGLPRVEHGLSVLAKSGAEVAPWRAWQPSDAELVIVLDALPTDPVRVAGRVVNPDGTAVSGKVAVYGLDHSGTPLNASLDDRGAFRFALHRIGRHEIWFHEDGAFPTRLVAFEVRAGEDLDLGDLALERRKAALRVVVAAPTWSEDRVRLDVVTPNGSGGVFTRDEAGGHVALLPPGNHVFRATDGEASALFEFELNSGASEVRHLRLEPAVPIGFGWPIEPGTTSPRASYTIRSRDHALVVVTSGSTTGGGGSGVAMRRLVPGRYRVDLTLGDGRHASRDVVITAGSGPVEIWMEPR